MNNIGDKRRLTCFAWLPMLTSDGNWIWLRRYYVYETYGWFEAYYMPTMELRWAATWRSTRPSFYLDAVYDNRGWSPFPR